MNRKQLTILLVLVAVLGGAGLFLTQRNQETWSSPDAKLGKKLLENFQINDIAQIHLVGDSELNILKKDDMWRVQERGNYPANFAQISTFLLKLGELKITQSEPVEPSQLADLALVEPKAGEKAGPKTATLIELRDAKGKTLQTVLLGIKHTRKTSGPYGENEYPDGRYVMLRSDTKNALLIGDPLGSSDPKPEQWLNKDFLKVDKIKTVSFVSTDATNSWTMTATNETSPLALADCKTNEVLDVGKASSIGATLGNPSFVDVAVNATPEQTGLDKPAVVNVETFNHFSYTFKIGKKNPENNYYMTVAVNADLPRERTPGKDEKPEDKAKLDKAFIDKTQQLEEKLKQEKSLEKWTYLVTSYTAEPLVRNRADLMQAKVDKTKDAIEIKPDAEEQPQTVPIDLTPTGDGK